MPGLGDIFRNALASHSDRPALWVDGKTYTYAQLSDEAGRVARIVERDGRQSAQRPWAILAQKSLPAYAGVLAAALTGRAYVPLNSRFPHERNLQIAKLASVSAILADSRTATPALALRNELDGRVAVAVPGETFLQSDADASAGPPLPQDEAHKGGTAYIMFTSGTTGQPKGVRVLNSNVRNYIDSMQKIAPLTPQDRCTQLFDFSFDLSVHDLFVTWSAGACLYVLPREDDLGAVDFVRKHALTSWFSVPAAASIAHRMRQLSDGAMPTLRLSMFCGEALPVSAARAWASAAPNSDILNLYGPTEATIAITSFRYGRGQDLGGQRSVPIGAAFPGQEAIVVDASGKEAPQGQPGELLLGGSQITAGYVNNELANAERFVSTQFEGRRSTRWYRTGDVCVADGELGLTFRGRSDDQIKINGYRVELQEVEAALRGVVGNDVAAIVPWPIDADGAVQGLVGFACTAISESQIGEAMAKVLPPYMVPRRITLLESMPLTTSGKIDRQKLRQMCETR